MHCASLGYDTAHLAHLRSALAERGGTASRQETGAAPGQSWYRSAPKLGRAALKANARRFAANMRPIIDEIMRAGGVQMHDPTLKSTNATCWKTRFFGYLLFHSDEICSVRVRLTTADMELGERSKLSFNRGPKGRLMPHPKRPRDYRRRRNRIIRAAEAWLLLASQLRLIELSFVPKRRARRTTAWWIELTA